MTSPTLYAIPGTKVTSPCPVQPTPAEIRLVFSLQRYFDPQYIFVDYYAPKVNFQTQHSYDLTDFTLSASVKHLAGSEFVQIDCIAINQQGIFVFESKDYSGYIYGDGRLKHWTQTLSYGKVKHQFYNPVRQNQLHLTALQDFLSTEFPYYSLIIFGRQATIKAVSNLPTNCQVGTQAQLGHLLQPCHAPQTLSDSQISQIYRLLQTHRINPTTATRLQHIQDLKP